MKKINLIISLCSLPFFVSSQNVENFETWFTNPEGAPFNWQFPADWFTSNEVTEFIAHSVLKSDEAYEGHSAANLRSNVIFGELTSGFIYFGYGSYDYANLKIIPAEGKLMTSRQVQIKGWYKYVSENEFNDGVSVANVVRLNLKTAKYDTMKQVELLLPPVKEYTAFEYIVDAGPQFDSSRDRLQLFFFSNKAEDTSGQSDLWIDYVEIVNVLGASAGDDTSVCVFFETGFEPFTLGDLSTGSGGNPPYTYSWSADYFDGVQQLSASDFLDDTTNANPLLVQYVDSSVVFYLKVTDNSQNQAIDSIRITFSTWIKTLDVKICHLNEGDSCQLYTSVIGGIEPLSYLWSPTEGLSDPTDLTTWAFPDSSTQYTLIIEDAIGCQTSDVFHVFIMPTSTFDVNASLLRAAIFPNPVFDQSVVQIKTTVVGMVTMKVYNSIGQLINQFDSNMDELVLHKKDYYPGIHFFTVQSTNVIISSGSFVVE